ncbi:MAG: putative transposase [Mycobacterium sp.]|jgi:transposase|nr:putative transposase [Mycobacterium sp.]MDT5355288.1 putative transposase [Mycobacterium sp.]
MGERHCRDARFVWNLAVEQFNWGGSGRSAPGSAERMRQLAEARREFEWLGCGSSAVQQQALRDFDWAVKEFFNRARGRPRWRKRGRNEGFCVRDTKVRVHGRKWAQVHVPKLGWVRFRLSRPLPPSALGMARITRDRGDRWHVSFPGPQPGVPDAGRCGRAVGIDRGVATTVATSDGQMLRAPVMRQRQRERLARLQQKLARQRKCSARWQATKAEIGRVHQRVADRRRDWVEKVTTRLAANYELVAAEALPVRAMVRRPKPKPDPDNSGQFLPNGAAAKAGLNRSIHANCWGLIAKRLEQKMSPSGTTLVVVPAQYSSQQCRKCGHISPENRKSQAEFRCQLCGHADHADANAAAVILARAMPAPTPGPGATPSGVLAKART